MKQFLSLSFAVLDFVFILGASRLQEGCSDSLSVFGLEEERNERAV